MKLTIHRGTKEIGGTLVELKTEATRLLIDAGYPLLLNGEPIDDWIARLDPDELLHLGVLPPIAGLYRWDVPTFDGVVISHAHIDHYGLLKYIHPSIPIHLSRGTHRLIQLTQLFGICDEYAINAKLFEMYDPFVIGDVVIKPFLMDHSAFDAAAFECSAEGKTVLYTGDFRGHGRKHVCLDHFIRSASKGADVLLIEGTMFGRTEEAVPTESELEEQLVELMNGRPGPLLFQSSSQNIDRLVTFYRAAMRLKKTFVIDVYTANVIHELRQLGNRLPYPSSGYPNIKVFYPYRLTQKLFNAIGPEYAKRFSPWHISKEALKECQENVVMLVRPSMLKDLELSGLKDGTFVYSMWQGYRGSAYQQRFETLLSQSGFDSRVLHTSGHAKISDIERITEGTMPKKIVPIHTLFPDAFGQLSDRVHLMGDQIEFEV